MQCPHCNQEHPQNARFCPVTGKDIPLPVFICPNCRNELEERPQFCPYCGISLVSDERPKASIIPEKPVMPARENNQTKIFGILLALGAILVLTGIFLLLFPQGSTGIKRIAANPPSSTGASSGEIPGASEGMESQTAVPGTLTSESKNVQPSARATKPPSAPTSTKTLKPTATREPTATPLPTATPTPVNAPLALEINAIDGAEIVLIPEGEFLMGSDPDTDPYFYGSEGPPHPVFLDEYWIYRAEVTNAMYQKCVEAHACPRPERNTSNTRAEYYGNPDFANYPVVYVTWRHAAAYCVWAGGSLPTEAQWEKAARGTDGRLFPWGDEKPTSSLARFDTTDTAAVGSYPDGASPYGVYDMAGNVIEWVLDYFTSLYYSSSPYENPLGPASSTTRVYRGGAYHNPVDGIRTVMRGSRSESHANVDIGFRCVIIAP
ncbi:MAG: SUMF1/EgtB/PvdO family nonheme iron enzyme [Anaerolineales bacterium]|nr:SUMF1/EgtB/PvdO family nonheme iron enzyme [Anaerolineales bacterium]